MVVRNHAVPILRTKLHRPPVARDWVPHTILSDLRVDTDPPPLTLVSAPAGYGKSTAVSHWIETSNAASAWLSLDPTDSDIRTFLSYVVAAVQTAFPDACGETRRQIEAPVLAPLPVLAGCINNDFDDLDCPLLLVLDDYHRIKEPAIHELLAQLLAHPPAALRLVILSRYEPSLPLGALRAHNRVHEVRTPDLMFTPAETAIFLQQATEQSLSGGTVSSLYRHTEGWVAGLRLAALALRHQDNADRFLREFNGNARSIQDYLIDEVLSKLPPAVVDQLCRAAILDRFSAPLCEQVCRLPESRAGDGLSGPAFIQLLEDNGLFCIALDGQGQWYRYHHLFKQLLQRQLEKRLAAETIAALHRRAAAWFEAQGLLEEAIHHSLRGDGPSATGQLMVRHRGDILNGEQWHRLDRWLSWLPPDAIDNDPELLVLKAWHLQNHGRYTQAFAILDRIQAVIGSAETAAAASRLQGSVYALRSRQDYDDAHGDLALEHIEQALTLLPPDCLAERAYAIIHKAGALQLCGQLEQAYRLLDQLLSDTSVPLGVYQARLLMTRCFVAWIAADLAAMQRSANECLTLGETLGLTESVLLGRYFLGIAHYHKDELAQAEAMLLPNTTFDQVANLEYLAESTIALTSVYQAQGRTDQAWDMAKSLCEFMMAARNTALLQHAQSWQADLALRQGRLAEAASALQRHDPESFKPQTNFYFPTLTQVKLLIAEASETSLARAADLLSRLEAFCSRVHSTRFLIEVLILQASLHDALGDQAAARDALTRAVTLALNGGFIRLFIDLGPGCSRLVGMLDGLDLDEQGRRQVGLILAARQSNGETPTGKPQATGNAGHSLTKRELEILALLAEDLRNKQIAQHLSISKATVKRHTENIYRKLGVSARRKAVTKAIALGIISSNITSGHSPASY